MQLGKEHLNSLT